MQKFEYGRAARFAAAAGLGLTLAFGAAPVVALANPAGEGEASLLAADNVVQIKTEEQLKDAIENQADGQTWILSAGEYVLDGPVASKEAINSRPNGTEFAFPIWVDNLTIKGDGDVTITSSWNPGEETGGNWSNQNFITVAGKGVTIEGVKLKGNPNGYYGDQCNKVIELVDDASDFTLKDATLLPIKDTDDKVTSGSIYVSVSNPGNTTIDNVTMYSWINARAVEAGSLAISNVTQDFTNNTYAGYHDTSGNYGWNPGVSGNSESLKVDGLNIVVDDNIEFEQQLMTDQFKSGTTITLASDIELHNPLNIIGISDLVIDGQGHTITAAVNFAADENNQFNLVKPQGCSNITFKNVNMVATSANKHVLDVYGSKGIVLDNVVLDHSDAGQNGAPLIINGSSVEATGPLTLVTGMNSWYAANVDSKNGDASFTVDSDVVDGFSMTGSNVGEGIKLESPAGGSSSTVILGDQTATSSDGTSSSISKSVAMVGESSFSTLQAAFDAVAQKGGTIELTSDVVLDDSIDVPATDITINGSGHTVSFACADAKGILGHQNSGVRAGTKLIVNGVHFKNTSGNQQGFAILLAYNSNGTEVTANNCTFENLHSGVYVNPVTAAEVTLPKVAINNGNYIGTKWGYSVDTVSNQDAIAVGWDVAFTGQGDGVFQGKSEVFAGNTFVLVDANGTHDMGFDDFSNALKVVGEGQTIVLNEDVVLDGKLTIPANKGFNIDGNGRTMSLKEDVSVDSGAMIEVLADNVTISDLNLNASQAKHGVQFYRVKDGKLENVTVNGGYWTSVQVNGSKVELENCVFQPIQNGKEAPYANVEYAMGKGVKDVPSITFNEYTHWAGDYPLVYADEATLARVLGDELDVGEHLTADQRAEAVKTINNNLTGAELYLKSDGTATSDEPSTPSNPGGSVSSGEQVKVAETEGGKVSVTPTRADEGDEVTITATPDEGQEVREVTVTDVDGKSVQVKAGEKDGEYVFTMPDGAVTVTVTFGCDGGELCPTHGFNDVDQSAWYHDAVDWAVESGLLNGYGEGGESLGPVADVTRAEMAQMLWNRAGRPEATADLSAFTDVASDGWYAPALAWCVSEGIFSGYGDTFGTERVISREEAATVLWRLSGSPEADADLSGYGDATKVSDYAAGAMEWAVSTGVLTGKGGVALDPQAGCTRGEVAAMMMRMAE